ncbi:MAG: AAA family ATPase [Bacteroidales bacterium]|jgi:predicted ATPase|nr:ATP-binding protein [Bacteroidales bacterium]MDD2203933.1 AAA family ATPase [Bacteroidales bacterium]MDD3913052.1 AAA family ATPase [Bacteroidales bacterium]MDD4632967.1 AAA family ATPase [Bacteroidales bacterium]
MEKFITTVKVENLWGRINFFWNKVNPDVNVIVGINGSGKSTILNAMYSFLNNPTTKNPDFPFDKMSISFSDGTMVSTNEANEGMSFSVDILNREENSYAYVTNKLKMLKKADASHLSEDLKDFTAIVDKLFSKTQKTVEFDDDLSMRFRDRKQEVLNFDKLSSGEKQMLIFLYKVLLSRRNPYIFFLDEPELSLHVEWQAHLIDIIRSLNPNCQLFIVTHSPNIFANGWGDKLQFIEDYITEF